MIERRHNAADERVGWVQGVARSAVGVTTAAFARAGFADPRLVTNWAEIVGPQIAALCLPLKLSGGVLTLRADAGANVFLAYETRRLVERINAYLGRAKVTRIKIIPGAMTSTARAPQTRRIAAETVPQDDPVSGFTGPEGLHAALVRLARARHGRSITR